MSTGSVRREDGARAIVSLERGKRQDFEDHELAELTAASQLKY